MWRKFLEQNGMLEAILGVLLLLFGLRHPTFAFAVGAGMLIVLGVYRMQESGVIPSLEHWIWKDSHEKADTK